MEGGAQDRVDDRVSLEDRGLGRAPVTFCWLEQTFPEEDLTELAVGSLDPNADLDQEL